MTNMLPGLPTAPAAIAAPLSSAAGSLRIGRKNRTANIPAEESAQ